MERLILLFVLFFGVSVSFSQKDTLRLGLPVGHSASVNSASFSPDGKQIITASRDRTAKIWDTENGKLLHSLEGHADWVTSVSFSPDGRKVVTASKDKTIKIWDTESGGLLQTLEGHEMYVGSAVFNNLGDKIVTASEDKTAKVWDVQTGKQLYSLNAHTDNVHTAIFSPNGQNIVTVSDDQTAKVWNVENGELIYSLKGVYTASFNPDGKKMITTSYGQTTKVLDVKSGKLLLTIEGNTDWFNSASFSPDGKKIVTASSDKTARIWNAKNGKLIQSLEGHTESVNTASFSPDGKKIVTVSHDFTAKIWNAENGKLLQTLITHTERVMSAVFSPDGKKIITTPKDKTAKVWSVEKGELIYSLEGHTDQILSAFYSPDGKNIITVSHDYVAKVWDTENGKLRYVMKGVYSILFSLDGKNILTTSYDQSIKAWSIENGDLLFTSDGYKEPDIISVTLSPDGDKILTVTRDYTVKIWDAKEQKLLHQLKGHTDGVNSVNFSSDGKIVTTSWDNTAKIWDANSGELLRTIEGKEQKINSAIFSPDGESLLTIFSQDSTLNVWNIKNGELRYKLEGYDAAINTAKFSPDGTQIITASRDNTAKIWESRYGQLLHTLEGHEDGVTSAVFSPDGKRVATISRDYTVKIWDTEKGNYLHSLEGHTAWITSLSFNTDGKRIITSSVDGSFIIFDEPTGQQLLQQFVFDDKEILTLTPHGLFDATSGAMDLMYWLKDNEIIDFTQLKDRYWEPGLWRKVMEGEQLRSVQGMKELKMYPEIELGEIKDGILPIHLTKRDGGYGRVVVYINEKEVVADARGSSSFDAEKPQQIIQYNLKNSPLLKLGERNIITVKVWTEDGFAESRGARVEYIPEGKATSKPPSFYAIVSGVTDFQNPSMRLNFSKPDADAVSIALQTGAEELFGKDRTHIYTLTSPGEVLPTKENFKRIFEKIKAEANPEDILVLYLSGHGITWGGTEGDFYYLTSDAFSSQVKDFNDPVIREKSTISTREFTEWIKEIPALKQVMVIDACGSGKAIDNLIVKRDIDASQIKSIDRMKDRTGMFIISGCAADAVSYEASRYGQGLLTYSLLQAMKGAKLRENKFVDVNDILNYAKDQVPVMAKGIGGIQEPQLLIPKGGSFDIGLMSEEGKKKIPLASLKPVFVRSNLFNPDELDDNLSLSSYLDEQLSNLTTKGNQAELIFIDVKDYPEGCKVSGMYMLKEGVWILKGKIKCGESEEKIELKAENKEKLEEKLVEVVKGKVR